MSRAGATESVVYVQPTNNAYTALAAAGMVASLVGLVVLYMQAKELFDGNGLW